HLVPFASKQTQKPIQWIKGVNIVVKKPLFDSFAVGLEGAGDATEKDTVLNGKKRLFFFVPWRGYTIIGTSYKAFRQTPDRLSIEAEELEALIKATNRIYPAANLTFNDVSFFHTGLLPAENSSRSAPFYVRLENRAAVIDHEKFHGLKGLLSVKSVKYTTAPQMAKKVKDLLEKKGMFPILKKKQSNKEGAKKCYQAKPLSRDNATHEEMTEPLSRNPRVTGADVIFSVRKEMALKLSDIIFRRTDLGTAECPSEVVLHRIADLMAEELSWDHNRKSNEIKEVLSCYK
ncbi:MAG: glycerol-3-phosphate dehydrogenase C-terminal domain-containing protein, partial [Desulfobacterales bacterium]